MASRKRMKRLGVEFAGLPMWQNKPCVLCWIAEGQIRTSHSPIPPIPPAPSRGFSPRQLPTNYDPAVSTCFYESDPSSSYRPCALRLRCRKLQPPRQEASTLVGGRLLKTADRKTSAPVKGIDRARSIRTRIAHRTACCGVC